MNINGRDLIDGGVVNNTPLSHAVALGADRVWVLPTGYACALRQSPQGALAMALHAVTLTINQRLAVDVARFEDAVDLRVIPPLCPIGSSPVDFSQSASLIERSHRATQEWLPARHRVTRPRRRLLGRTGTERRRRARKCLRSPAGTHFTAALHE